MLKTVYLLFKTSYALNGIFSFKSRKDKLWKIECTIPNHQVRNLCYDLKEKIPFSAYEVLNSKYTVFNIYCKTQLESQYVKECLQDYNAKYFVSESKNL